MPVVGHNRGGPGDVAIVACVASELPTTPVYPSVQTVAASQEFIERGSPLEKRCGWLDVAGLEMIPL